MSTSKSKRTKVVRLVIICLALIGAWTVVDNTYRLGRAVVHTVTNFKFTPPHIVAEVK